MLAMKTLTDVANYTDLVAKIKDFFDDEFEGDEDDKKRLHKAVLTLRNII